MASPRNLVDPAVLKKLVPAASLSADNFRDFAAKAVLETIPPGETICERGAKDGKTIFLISGELELVDGKGGTQSLSAGTQAALHPVAHQQPREFTVRAKGACEITRVESDGLDILVTWDQVSGIEVTDLSASMDLMNDESGDWMTQMLQSRAFRSLPPASIQGLFMSFEETPVNAGDVIVRQGDAGEYYYVIGRGEFEVSRGSGGESSKRALATLKPGQAFGEEALLSQENRNATVTAKTDGLLMRLSSADFSELLQGPVLTQVGLDDAKTMVKAGAMLMDVRMESEHKQSCIKGSFNVPLYTLRLKLTDLNKDRGYVCYCDTGRRSQAAAYLLTQEGFEACVLEGGLQAVSQAMRQAPTV